MPAYKDKEKGTWYVSFYHEDWTGKKAKKMKRGFPTKREALEWERTFLQQQTADLEMTFESFVAVYVADMKGRIKENTWVSFARLSFIFLMDFSLTWLSTTNLVCPCLVLPLGITFSLNPRNSE